MSHTNRSRTLKWPKTVFRLLLLGYLGLWLGAYVAVARFDRAAVADILPWVSLPYMWLITVSWPARQVPKETDEHAKLHIAAFMTLLVVATSLGAFAGVVHFLPRIEVQGHASITGSLRGLMLALTAIGLACTGKLWTFLQGVLKRRLEKLPEILVVIVIGFVAVKVAQQAPRVFEKELAESFELFAECLEAALVGYGVLAYCFKVEYPSKRAARTTRAVEIRADYESDVTRFLAELKQARPELEERQRQGRALLWDKLPIDLDERRAHRESAVPWPRDSSR